MLAWREISQFSSNVVFPSVDYVTNIEDGASLSGFQMKVFKIKFSHVGATKILNLELYYKLWKCLNNCVNIYLFNYHYFLMFSFFLTGRLHPVSPDRGREFEQHHQDFIRISFPRSHYHQYHPPVVSLGAGKGRTVPSNHPAPVRRLLDRGCRGSSGHADIFRQ